MDQHQLHFNDTNKKLVRCLSRHFGPKNKHKLNISIIWRFNTEYVIPHHKQPQLVFKCNEIETPPPHGGDSCCQNTRVLSMKLCFVFHYKYSTFRVLIEVSDVLSGIAADALGADPLAHLPDAPDLLCAAVCLPHEGEDVSVDLGKHERGVVFELEFTLLDGLQRDGATAEHS